MENLDKYYTMAADWAMTFIPKLLLAIFILIVGLWIVKRISKLVQRAFSKANFAPEVQSFLGSIIDIILKVGVILFAAGTLGFELTSLVAILAAAGFAVGMALQGNLGNFAAGITVMVFKPYKVGDWIECQDKFGKVESIQIFNTILGTPGEKTLIIPNGQVVEGVITNFSTKGNIRLELNVSMPYEESFPRVKKIIEDSLVSVPGIIHEPAPLIGIETYDSHTIILSIRPMIDPENYWEVTFAANAAIKEALSQHGVKVAYSEGVELGPIGV